MCGIAGIVNINNSSIDHNRIDKMTDVMFHRGPDHGESIKFDRCHLGHRRLSIIDTSSSAHQPFKSNDGKWCMVFNGEIYNYKAIKTELLNKGHSFKTTSDTEVLMYAYQEYGRNVVDHLEGIFAFAIWDIEEQSLFSVRDHIGVKPFYYHVSDHSFSFASEIKAILQNDIKAEINTAKVTEYLQYGAVGGSETLFKGIKRLLPGHWLSIKDNKVETGEYFHPFRKGIDSSINQQDIEDRLNYAITSQMVSDVPLGTMCSGGLDSSYITAVSAQQTDFEINAYCVKIPFPHYDETKYAKIAAKAAKAKYNELEFLANESADMLPTLIWLHDEPMRHPNSVPIFQISKMARQDVIVLLSGEGADEIFGGYGTYLKAQQLSGKWKFVPGWAGNIASRFSKKSDRGKGYFLAVQGKNMAESLVNIRANANRSEILNLVNDKSLDSSQRIAVMQEALDASNGDLVNAAMYYDQFHHLQTLLDRQDKMCMGTSVESRVPFLDHQLVALNNALPSSEKIKIGETKAMLRNIGEHQLPKEIIHRPKFPFGVPLFDQYLNSSTLNEYFNNLNNSPLVRDGILSARGISQLMSQFSKGMRYYDDLMWNVFNLDLWYRIFITEEIEPQLSYLPFNQQPQ